MEIFMSEFVSSLCCHLPPGVLSIQNSLFGHTRLPVTPSVSLPHSSFSLFTLTTLFPLLTLLKKGLKTSMEKTQLSKWETVPASLPYQPASNYSHGHCSHSWVRSLPSLGWGQALSLGMPSMLLYKGQSPCHLSLLNFVIAISYFLFLFFKVHFVDYAITVSPIFPPFIPPPLCTLQPSSIPHLVHVHGFDK